MTSTNLQLDHFALTALAIEAVSAAAAGDAGAPDKRSRFVRDLANSYESQYIALDLEDVNMVLCGVRAPVLGVGTGAGADRAVLAARAAVRQAGRLGEHALVVIAFPCGEGRLREYKLAIDAVGDAVSRSAQVVYGVCDDGQLASGSARVSVLTG